jgi:adenylylsulfate kinase
MLSEIYEWNRNNLENYFEIYLDVPMSELRSRDQKGIYSSFEKGEINNVMGLDLEVDIPIEPDIHICWNENVSTESSVKEIYETLIRQKRM